MKTDKLARGYNGYELTQSGRSKLLGEISPLFKKTFAHHVTNEFGVYESEPPMASTVEAFAKVDNGDSVQAVIVKVNGSYIRPDGKVYHITVSLDPSKGAKPNHSNDVIQDYEWQYLTTPFSIQVTPKFFRFGQ